jgi:hypothetical protein
MRTRGVGTFAGTLFSSFVFGFACFMVVTRQLYPDDDYQHDFFSSWILAPLGALAGFFVSSVIHELAHFFTARYVGAFVRKIKIGSGRLLTTFRFMGTRCDIAESLKSGAVYYFLLSREGARTRMFLITASAPWASLLLAAVAVTLVVSAQPVTSPATLLYYFYPVLVGFTAPCVFFLPGVLIPLRYSYGGRIMESDAMKLLTIPFYTDERIAENVMTGAKLFELENEFDPETVSLKEALENADAAPEDPRALGTAIAFLRITDDPRTAVYFQKLIALPLSPANRIRFVDQFVTWCLDANAVVERKDEIDRLSLELFSADPDNVTVAGTRGSALIDLGRVEEGKALLHHVLAKSAEVIDKTYSHVFLALAAKAEENSMLAREHAVAAEKLDPACPVLKRVADLLEPEVRRS